MASPTPGFRGCTPACDKAASKSTCQLGYTEAQRQAVLLDIHKSVQEVDVSFFVKAVLPPVDDALVATVLEKLKTSPAHYITNTGRLLRGFPEDPCKSKRGEEAVFKPLDAVINAIIKAGASTCQRKPRLEFKSNPNMTPEFKSRQALSRPDASLIRLQALLAWINFVCAVEFKKLMTDETIRDVRNVLKVPKIFAYISVIIM